MISIKAHLLHGNTELDRQLTAALPGGRCDDLEAFVGAEICQQEHLEVPEKGKG